LADKYEEENKKIEDKEQKTYDRLKSKESDKLPGETTSCITMWFGFSNGSSLL
jgi:hypothetical protein